MSYPDAAWERAMKVEEVMLKALSGEIHWFRAADILGFSPRTLRRWRQRYETHGYVGLVDKRRYQPSVRRIAAPEVERLLRLSGIAGSMCGTSIRSRDASTGCRSLTAS